jgi:hypothetical protein
LASSSSARTAGSLAGVCIFLHPVR